MHMLCALWKCLVSKYTSFLQILRIFVLPNNIKLLVDVVSSDTYSRIGRNTTMLDQSRGWTRWILDWFRSSYGVIVLCPVLLYYAMKNLWIACPRYAADCYFYSQENYLIDMTSFWLCYDLNKHASDWDFILGLHPASWTVAVIGPPVQINICGIITAHQSIVKCSFIKFSLCNCMSHVIEKSQYAYSDTKENLELELEVGMITRWQQERKEGGTPET
jgi:hypothetical protein